MQCIEEKNGQRYIYSCATPITKVLVKRTTLLGSVGTNKATVVAPLCMAKSKSVAYMGIATVYETLDALVMVP